eukprot:758738-Hanusia_phi.AAC.8
MFQSAVSEAKKASTEGGGGGDSLKSPSSFIQGSSTAIKILMGDETEGKAVSQLLSRMHGAEMEEFAGTVVKRGSLKRKDTFSLVTSSSSEVTVELREKFFVVLGGGEKEEVKESFNLLDVEVSRYEKKGAFGFSILHKEAGRLSLMSSQVTFICTSEEERDQWVEEVQDLHEKAKKHAENNRLRWRGREKRREGTEGGKVEEGNMREGIGRRRRRRWRRRKGLIMCEKAAMRVKEEAEALRLRLEEEAKKRQMKESNAEEEIKAGDVGEAEINQQGEKEEGGKEKDGKEEKEEEEEREEEEREEEGKDDGGEKGREGDAQDEGQEIRGEEIQQDVKSDGEEKKEEEKEEREEDIKTIGGGPNEHDQDPQTEAKEASGEVLAEATFQSEEEQAGQQDQDQGHEQGHGMEPAKD